MSGRDVGGGASEDARPGDWLLVDSASGPSRRGQILEVLGPAARPHYRVRWDEEHVSLFFPEGHTHVIHAGEKP
ncbi:MAG TPA: DUF1918 domain-containing protein [Solirubrobacteraceae bacterium]